MPSIEKTVLNDDSCVYYDYLEDIIKEIMNMDTSSLKKNLLADFTYQSLCRWRSESKILELKLDSFMNKVLDSNYYEGVNYLECCRTQLKRQSMILMKIKSTSIILKVTF